MMYNLHVLHVSPSAHAQNDIHVTANRCSSEFMQEAINVGLCTDYSLCLVFVGRPILVYITLLVAGRCSM